jgi:hypothetical protein
LSGKIRVAAEYPLPGKASVRQRTLVSVSLKLEAAFCQRMALKPMRHFLLDLAIEQADAINLDHP